MWEQARQALGQSTARFLTRVAGILPGLVALIMAFLISIVFAWILARVVRRLLTSMHFDERLVHWGFSSIAEWSPLSSPTRLVSRGVGLLVIVMGFLIGVAAFDAELPSQLIRSVLAYVPNILGALLVLLVGNLIARFLARSILIGSVNMNFQYGRLLSVGVKWLVNVLAIAMALEHLKIASEVVELAFGILFGGIVFALALAVSLNSREIVSKSLERDERKHSSEAIADPLRHL